MSNIVDAVQIPSALLIEHILTLAAYNFQGVRTIEKLAGLPREKQLKCINLVIVKL